MRRPRLRTVVLAAALALAVTANLAIAQSDETPVALEPAPVQPYQVVAGDNFYVIGERLCGPEHRVAVGEEAFRMNPGAGVLTVGEVLSVPSFCPARTPATTVPATTESPATTSTVPATTPPTSQPTTSSSSPTTSTTLPPSGSAFSDGFAGDLSAYSPSVFSTDRSTGWGPNNVRIEGGALVNECGAQNYGDCVLRLPGPWTGDTISFDLATPRDAHGYAEVVFTDRPYTVTSFAGENANGPMPANGFAVYVRCPDADARSWVDHVQVDHGDIGPCNSNGPDNTTKRYEIIRSGLSVTVRVNGVVVESFTSLAADGPLWVSFGTHNHATFKYANLPTFTTRWDNLTVDEVTAPTSCWLALNTNSRTVTDASRLTYSINGTPATQVPFDRRHLQQEAHAFSIPVTCPPQPATVDIGFVNVGDTSDGGGIRGGPRNVQIIGPTGGGTSPTSSTSTSAPASTAPSTSTTAVIPTTSTSITPTTAPTTTSTVAPTVPTTRPPSGLAFRETFDTAEGFYDRFDFGVATLSEGTLFGAYEGDHSMACSGPAERRIVDLDPGIGPVTPTQVAGQTGKAEAFWWCAPGGEASRGHVMTALNGEGYFIGWMSPRQTFTNVSRVCWDQNLTHMGGGKWTLVAIAPVADVERERQENGHLDLGWDPPGFQDPNGPTTRVVGGPDHVGVKVFNGNMSFWRGGDFVGGEEFFDTLQSTDKATRFRHCFQDNGNGTVTMTQARPGGMLDVRTVAGRFPDGPVRVSFEDDSYDPPKRDGYRADTLTWHFDGIEVWTA